MRHNAYLVCSAALVLVACSSPLREYRCETSQDCGTVATESRCEPSGHCSFADDACLGGFRFGQAAANESGLCVDESSVAPDANPSQPDANPSQPDADPSQPDANSGCIVWQTDFSSDPTQLDNNSDSEPDWVVREGGAFPTEELGDDGWYSSSFSAYLDSNPRHNFDGKTTLTGTFRSPIATSELGAVFWINVDSTGSSFAPLYLSLRRNNVDTQTLTLYGRAGMELVSVPGLDGGDITARLDIDASSDQVTLTVDDVDIGTYSYEKSNGSVEGRLATAVASGSEAVFKSLRVEACP